MPHTLTWETAVAIALTVLVIAIGSWLICKHRTRGSQAVNLRDKAHREAIAALAVCPTHERIATATECSLILRRFLANACGDKALFETHEEWIARHDVLESLSEIAKQRIHGHFCKLAEWKYAPSDHGDEPAVIVEHSRDLLETLNRELTA